MRLQSDGGFRPALELFTDFFFPQTNGEPANAAIKELKAAVGEDQKGLEVYKEWNTEATALDELSNLSHPHMIQVRAIITRGKKHYFMFQWADGGCLRDFYVQNRRPGLDSGFVKEVMLQLSGLASALDALHNYKEGEESYRHGDLKPENILRFKDGTRVGTWKVADMGLAKHHFAPTGARGDQTTTRYGTPSYEPPEVIALPNSPKGPRSRLYDIWSMGCITLELILWLLYGYDWLLEFNNSFKVPMSNASPYWMLGGYGDDLVPTVHSSVTKCIDHIIAEDPECTESTAICDLLYVVRAKLLVVALPRDSKTFLHPSTAAAPLDVPTSGPTINLPEGRRPMLDPFPGPFRAKAKAFCAELEKILQKGEEDDRYWYTGKMRDGVSAPPIPLAPGSKFLTPQAPGLQIPLVDRTRDAPLQDGPSGLRAPSPRPDVGHYFFFKNLLRHCRFPSLLTKFH
jgi:serine/threonine protein kinase